MFNLLEKLLKTVDSSMEKGARSTARQYGRRTLLARAGVLLAGGALLPLLPFDRSSGQAHAATSVESIHDPFSCDYWRYCALDGSLCNTSGGTTTSCPPGSEASKVAWIGTCRNPDNDKEYLVSYNDCCGKVRANGATECFRSEGERPGYRMGLYNDINWCMANENKGYHCTVAMLVGLADE